MLRVRWLMLSLVVAACGGASEPPTTETGFTWPESTPAAQGMDPTLLDSADARIRAELPNVNSFLVARNGALVYERYYAGATANTVFEIHSVTKSFVAAFVGIAMREGWITSVDEPVATFLPEYFEGATLDPRKEQITLRHLLTMSSGLDFERTNPAFDASTPDWVGAILGAPLAHDPGTAYLYDGGNPHLLSAIVTRLAGEPLTGSFGQEALFRPLNITTGRWVADPAGNMNGGTGMFLTARDMAKLGQLYLQDGVWEGERILPEGWVAQSTAVAYDLPSFWDYGFLWWVAPDSVYGSRTWIAAGYRGQLIMVVPAFQIVVVIQSESIQPRAPTQDESFLLARYVIPAAQ